MKTFSLLYTFKYTTAGGAHRYAPDRKTPINLGEVYLRGCKTPPTRITVTVEAE